jgi:hypothetical protein
MGYVWKQANPQKQLENFQKSSVIKLKLGVNKSIFLQLLGQTICQTIWFLIYFCQMK